ncbi:hypothetical protein Q31b_27080 [Novipirellula aureliae]|uniref:Uncharacterized protein n=1 Tax=Novipirellula aureliae TaxID=2527966 RepID=A0A5C6E296_9BACT|nr:hypothetical protein [Novipirellula aureliae]TWU41269.1 hypothetical protein Q31b_27080 [Novipirellula aureliae]
MKINHLSQNAQKCLRINIGEDAGREVADLLTELISEVERLRHSKVNVTQIVPDEYFDNLNRGLGREPLQPR